MVAETLILEDLARLRDMAPSGYVLALHVRFTSPRYMFQTYPDAWVEEYSQDGLMMLDPSVVWALTHTGSIGWSDLAPLDHAGVFARAAQHGLLNGVTMSLLREGSRSMAGFARADRIFTSTELANMEAALINLHDATTSGQPLSPQARDGLRRLSVTSTHP